MPATTQDTQPPFGGVPLPPYAPHDRSYICRKTVGIQSIPGTFVLPSIAFIKAPRREADNQPICQSVRQAFGQTVGRASKQVETHSLAFFPSRTASTNSGELQFGTEFGGQVVEHSLSASMAVGSNFGPSPASWFKSSKHKLLTPPPLPNPRKCDIQFQGDGGLKIKKSIGGSFCVAK